MQRAVAMAVLVALMTCGSAMAARRQLYIPDQIAMESGSEQSEAVVSVPSALTQEMETIRNRFLSRRAQLSEKNKSLISTDEIVDRPEADKVEEPIDEAVPEGRSLDDEPAVEQSVPVEQDKAEELLETAESRSVEPSEIVDEDEELEEEEEEDGEEDVESRSDDEEAEAEDAEDEDETDESEGRSSDSSLDESSRAFQRRLLDLMVSEAREVLMAAMPDRSAIETFRLMPLFKKYPSKTYGKPKKPKKPKKTKTYKAPKKTKPKKKPKGTYEAAKPTYSIPKPAPKPTYGAPAPAAPSSYAGQTSYSAPTPTYNAPKPTYGAPKAKPIPSKPKAVYGVPKPKATYGAPAAPAYPVQPIAPTYPAPPAPPAPTYAAPAAPSYAPPPAAPAAPSYPAPPPAAPAAPSYPAPPAPSSYGSPPAVPSYPAPPAAYPVPAPPAPSYPAPTAAPARPAYQPPPTTYDPKTPQYPAPPAPTAADGNPVYSTFGAGFPGAPVPSDPFSLTSFDFGAQQPYNPVGSGAGDAQLTDTDWNPGYGANPNDGSAAILPLPDGGFPLEDYGSASGPNVKIQDAPQPNNYIQPPPATTRRPYRVRPTQAAAPPPTRPPYPRPAPPAPPAYAPPPPVITTYAPPTTTTAPPYRPAPTTAPSYPADSGRPATYPSYPAYPPYHNYYPDEDLRPFYEEGDQQAEEEVPRYPAADASEPERPNFPSYVIPDSIDLPESKPEEPEQPAADHPPSIVDIVDVEPPAGAESPAFDIDALGPIYYPGGKSNAVEESETSPGSEADEPLGRENVEVSEKPKAKETAQRKRPGQRPRPQSRKPFDDDPFFSRVNSNDDTFGPFHFKDIFGDIPWPSDDEQTSRFADDFGSKSGRPAGNRPGNRRQQQQSRAGTAATNANARPGGRRPGAEGRIGAQGLNRPRPKLENRSAQEDPNLANHAPAVRPNGPFRRPQLAKPKVEEPTELESRNKPEEETVEAASTKVAVTVSPTVSASERLAAQRERVANRRIQQKRITSSTAAPTTE